MANKRNFDVERRLIGYALTAGAVAAVSASSAEASVIIFPVDLPIPASSTPTPVSLDVNNDGVPDFLFSNYIGTGTSAPLAGGFGAVTVQGNDPNDVFFGVTSTKGSSPPVPVPLALTLPKAEPNWPTPVPSKDLLPSGFLALASNSEGGQIVPLMENPGVNSTAAYALPLIFDDTLGNQYAGWARISTYLSAPFTLNAEIVDVGYESTPFTPIDVPGPAVPEPGTLGMLALGAAGLGLAKRRARKA